MPTLWSVSDLNKILLHDNKDNKKLRLALAAVYDAPTIYKRFDAFNELISQCQQFIQANSADIELVTKIKDLRDLASTFARAIVDAKNDQDLAEKIRLREKYRSSDPEYMPWHTPITRTKVRELKEEKVEKKEEKTNEKTLQPQVAEKFERARKLALACEPELFQVSQATLKKLINTWENYQQYNQRELLVEIKNLIDEIFPWDVRNSNHAFSSLFDNLGLYNDHGTHDEIILREFIKTCKKQFLQVDFGVLHAAENLTLEDVKKLHIPTTHSYIRSEHNLFYVDKSTGNVVEFALENYEANQLDDFLNSTKDWKILTLHSFNRLKHYQNSYLRLKNTVEPELIENKSTMPSERKQYLKDAMRQVGKNSVAKRYAFTQYRYDGERYLYEPEKRENFRYFPSNGVLMSIDTEYKESSGSERNTVLVLNTLNRSADYIFVLSPKGDLFLREENQQNYGFFHHASFLAGGATFFSGVLQVANEVEAAIRHCKIGELTSLIDKSGHYLPNQRHFIQALAYFRDAGLLNETLLNSKDGILKFLAAANADHIFADSLKVRNFELHENLINDVLKLLKNFIKENNSFPKKHIHTKTTEKQVDAAKKLYSQLIDGPNDYFTFIAAVKEAKHENKIIETENKRTFHFFESYFTQCLKKIEKTIKEQAKYARPEQKIIIDNRKR